MEQLSNDYNMDLALYRLESAKEDVGAAKLMLEAGHYKAANNRAYYAVFHAINAVHALDGNGFKRHKDALASFNRNYVKEGIFPRTLGRQIAEAQDIRHASDYDDFYIADRNEASEMISLAIEVINQIEQYIIEKRNK